MAANPAKGRRTGLFIVLGVVAVLFVGCGALGVLALNQLGETIDEVANDFSTLPLPVDTTGNDPSAAGAEDDSDDLGSLLGVSDGLGDVAGCTRLDSDALQVDVTNNSDVTVDYWLTIDLVDESGQRVSEVPGFVEDLRPGERTIEEIFIFNSDGSTCAVASAERFEVDTASVGADDVSGCGSVSADSFGDVTATVTATNSATGPSDYVITVAIIGDDGIRRGSGYAFIDGVAPGVTAASDLFTTIGHVDGYYCDVVSVDRSTY